VLNSQTCRAYRVTRKVLTRSMPATIQTICTDLQRCRDANPQPKVFGADSHGFVLNPPVKHSVITKFESRHQVTLPNEYREFLTQVGNGGAGPYYGVFKLGEMDDSFDHKRWKENDGFIGVLSEPFPHTKAWNDLPPYPEEQDDEDAYEAELQAFDDLYWNPKQVNGAIPICHQGCASRNWLVITGAEAGNVWEDLRADEKGLRPVKSKSRRRLTFFDWYNQWLEAAVAQLPPSSPKKGRTKR
jgi:hypothetical protein